MVRGRKDNWSGNLAVRSITEERVSLADKKSVSSLGEKLIRIGDRPQENLLIRLHVEF